ncbi:MAG TPA: glucose-6-phosphate isomerase, partial [Bacteroidales bacterium]|nr:glucose-6-phosphate isomerase [Bacteroidales bacterium]
MIQVKLGLEQLHEFISKDELLAYDKQIVSAYRKIYNKTGAGSDFLGWVDLPSSITEEEMARIEAHAAELRSKSEVFVVIGIGGSYLGARAVIETMTHHFAQLCGSENPHIIYAGQHISEDYTTDLLQLLDKKDYSMAVISKSGTTTEPAIAFRILKAHIEKKYGVEEARKRIVAITDKSRGALKQLADSEGYASYV